MKTTSLLVLAFGLILSTSAFAQYPGTGEDLNLTSAVNFAPLTGGPLNQSKTAAAGDLVTLHFESPNGAFIGNNFSLLATVFSSSGPSVPEVAPSTFPKIYANLSAPFPFFTVSVLGSGSIQNLGVPFILPPGGVSVSFLMPPVLAADSIMFQALTTGTNSANGFFTTTNGHVIHY